MPKDLFDRMLKELQDLLTEDWVMRSFSEQFALRLIRE